MSNRDNPGDGLDAGVDRSRGGIAGRARAYRIGIDLGGTKTEGVLMSPDGGIAHRLRVATPGGGYDAILRELCDLVARLRRGVDDAGGDGARVGVGMSMPGNITRAGLIKNSNTVRLNGRPFPADARRALGCDVRFANDADCLALSEATDGAAAGASTVFAVIIGTGVGGGIAVDARVVTGPNRTRGEWGHVPLPWPSAREYPGPPCYCGRRGCLETFVSGTGLENDYERATGHRVTAREIAAAAGGAGDSATVGDAANAGAGDGVAAVDGAAAAEGIDVAEAVAARRRYAHRLARGLAMMVNILDPDVIVLGGGMSNMDFLYDKLPALMRPWIFGGEFHTPIRRAMHGDSSGVRGAAWLAEAPGESRGR